MTFYIRYSANLSMGQYSIYTLYQHDDFYVSIASGKSNIFEKNLAASPVKSFLKMKSVKSKVGLTPPFIEIPPDHALYIYRPPAGTRNILIFGEDISV
jgi:hypothetical protein